MVLTMGRGLGKIIILSLLFGVVSCNNKACSYEEYILDSNWLCSNNDITEWKTYRLVTDKEPRVILAFELENNIYLLRIDYNRNEANIHKLESSVNLGNKLRFPPSMLWEYCEFHLEYDRRRELSFIIDVKINGTNHRFGLMKILK